MRTKKELLEMLRDYIVEDYDKLIEIARVNDDEYQELEEEQQSILEDIDKECKGGDK